MSPTTVTTLLATLALLAGGLGLLLLLVLLTSGGRSSLSRSLAGQGRSLLVLAWLVATTASSGSLYLSEVVGFIPCLLCWYQRIAMYPLVMILGVASLRGDLKVWPYVIPLAVVGVAIAGYHVFIQFLPQASVVQCSEAVPCTVRYLRVFGFVSIPVMAGMGFLSVAALTWAARFTEGEPDVRGEGCTPGPEGLEWSAESR